MSEQIAHPEHDRELAAQLRLRPEPPRVTRLSRRILIGLGAFAALAISSALMWPVRSIRRRVSAACPGPISTIESPGRGSIASTM